MVNDTYLINLRDHPHAIQGSDSDQDAAVNLEAGVLLNEEGIIQGSIKLYGEYYKPPPLKSPKKSESSQQPVPRTPDSIDLSCGSSG